VCGVSRTVGLREKGLVMSGCVRWVLLVWATTQPAGAPAGQRVATARAPLDFEQIIETAKRKVYPALVFVKPITETYESGERQRQEVFGSGVIISPDGLTVTNHHVVDKAITINCVLWNKQQVRAELIGKDKETDLALLRLECGPELKPLPYAEFADSDKLEEGQFVLALGAPFGFTRSISLGILANTRRYIGFRTMYKYNIWLQTDAAINPGNSGGPLVNTEGKIVGINTVKILWGDNVGFSIPSNVVQDIVSRLRKDGRVVRAWLGLRLQALKDFDSNTFIDSDRGVLIKGVEKGSPAETAGIESGDILLAVNGEAVDGTYVEELPAIRWRLADLPPGKPATLTIRRGDREQQITVTPVLKGRVEGEDFDCRRWNMTVKEINQYMNPDLYFYCKQGVFVQGVRSPGNARDAGIRRKDILLSVDGKKIRTLQELKDLYEKIIADETREKKVMIEILRSGFKRWVVLDYRKDYEEED